MELWRDFLLNDGKVIDKWHHYFPIYERHFAPFKNRPLLFIEIGVFKGGSLQMWRRYFGPQATIVGLDIDPRCKAHEGDGVHVRIGDQSDPVFLQAVLDEFGPPDVVLDDGSHMMKHVRASFEFLYPKISRSGCYMVEDLQTAYWEEFGGGLDVPDTFVNLAKTYIDELNAEHTRGGLAPSFLGRNTSGICFYEGVIAFDRGATPAGARYSKTGVDPAAKGKVLKITLPKF